MTMYLGRLFRQTQGVPSSPAINRVSENGELYRSEVSAQLVSSTRLRTQTEVREPIKALHHLPIGQRLSPLSFRQDALPIREFGVSTKRSFDPIRVEAWFAKHDRLICLLNPSLFERGL